MAALGFHRQGLWQGNTWAYRLFKRHHTQLNDLYWTYVPAANFARNAVSSAPNTDPATTLGHSHTDREVLQDSTVWLRAEGELHNWIRLSALMAVSSYFEVFLQKMITVALESDPGVQYGRPGAVDGFTFRKHSATYDLSPIAEGAVKGDWNKRGAAYTKLFGRLPIGWTAAVPGLETVRKIRNGVGHAFGRDTREYRDHWHLVPRKMVSVSHADLLGWLGLMEKLALTIDQHLGPTHVGEYETLAFIHQWKPTRNELGQGKARSLSRLLNVWAGHSPGVTFCKGAVAYYDSV